MLDRDQKKYIKFDALHGWEIVNNMDSLYAMNFLLHEIGGDDCPIRVEGALANDPGDRFEMVLTNPQSW